jgi:hypothetical protein
LRKLPIKGGMAWRPLLVSSARSGKKLELCGRHFSASLTLADLDEALDRIEIEDVKDFSTSLAGQAAIVRELVEQLSG